MVIKEVKVSTPDSARDLRPSLPNEYNSSVNREEPSVADSTVKVDTSVRLNVSASKKPEAGIERDGKVSAHDVAAFILQRKGEMTAMKLQKLVYYSQAWSLVWDEEPLFEEEIQAWANGPVVPALYARHQGLFKLREWNGHPERLTEEQRETILKVLEFYGDMPSQTLSDLTHQEGPWVKARQGLSIGERGSRVITHADMAEYYSSL